MKILFCKTFGLGNAVMAVPAIKALATIAAKEDGFLDVLVGHTSDDVGAYEVLSSLVTHGQYVRKVWKGSVPLEEEYDLAVMSIPYDGRWKPDVHFKAKFLLDGRTRPDPSTTGLVSWKKHEVEYQMENAYEMGFQGPVPSQEFMDSTKRDPLKIYLGVGYKKDAAGFWKVKHWGNQNFSKFVKLFLEAEPNGSVVTTGDEKDQILSIFPIMRECGNSRFTVEKTTNLQAAFDVLNGCSLYVGNDTGMMHVAASLGIPVVAPFMLENSIVKSRPYGVKNTSIDGSSSGPPPAELVFHEAMALLKGEEPRITMIPMTKVVQEC